MILKGSKRRVIILKVLFEKLNGNLIPFLSLYKVEPISTVIPSSLKTHNILAFTNEEKAMEFERFFKAGSVRVRNGISRKYLQDDTGERR